MTSSEFAEWLAYDQISPGEPERGDLRSALVASVIANSQKGKGRPYSISDFLLKFKTGKPTRKSAQEIKTKLKSWLSMYKSQAEK